MGKVPRANEKNGAYEDKKWWLWSFEFFVCLRKNIAKWLGPSRPLIRAWMLKGKSKDQHRQQSSKVRLEVSIVISGDVTVLYLEYQKWNFFLPFFKVVIRTSFSRFSGPRLVRNEGHLFSISTISTYLSFFPIFYFIPQISKSSSLNNLKSMEHSKQMT